MMLRLTLLLCFGALVSLSCAAIIKEFDDQWEGFEEGGVTPDEISSSSEESAAVVKEEEEEGEIDPRLNRKKRQAILPFYPVFSTRRSRRSRRRLAYPYLYSYYTYPYYNYPYYPYAPFYPTGTFPVAPPTTTNRGPATAAATTSSCGCAATNVNCLSNCYYNQYLQNRGVQG